MPPSLRRLFFGTLVAYAAGWLALTLLDEFVGLPMAFFAVPILVVAVCLGVAVVVGLKRSRDVGATLPPPRRRIEDVEAEEPTAPPWRPPPALPPTLDAGSGRRAFWGFAGVTMGVWLIPLVLAIATGSAWWMLLVPLFIVLGLYGLATALLLRLVARGAWNATWYGRPPPIPKWIARGAFAFAFAVGVAFCLLMPGFFIGPLGFVAFLVLPLILVGLLGRQRSAPSADGHPPGVPR